MVRRVNEEGRPLVRGQRREEDAFARGASHFDAGRFFDAHEVWEERWLVLTDGPDRILLQGLIQIAAGFHKLLSAGSKEAASRLLAKGLGKLEQCPDLVAEKGIGPFCDDVRTCAHYIETGQFDRSRMPVLAAAPGHEA
jgi:hypothetical protein